MAWKKLRQQQQPEEEKRQVKLIENIALETKVYERLRLYSCGDRYNDTYSKIISDLIDVNEGKRKPLEKRESFSIISDIRICT